MTPDITPESLEAEGFRRDDYGDWYIPLPQNKDLEVFKVTGWRTKWFTQLVDNALLRCDNAEPIATMTDLRQLIAVLKGAK
jgi:hypothetical protein